MPEIISEQRFLSEYSRLCDRYDRLSENPDHDERWEKLGKLLEKTKKCYGANRILVAKILRKFEKYQMLFKEEERAFVVQSVELIKKVLWQKKLNKEG